VTQFGREFLGSLTALHAKRRWTLNASLLLQHATTCGVAHCIFAATRSGNVSTSAVVAIKLLLTLRRSEEVSKSERLLTFQEKAVFATRYNLSLS